MALFYCSQYIACAYWQHAGYPMIFPYKLIDLTHTLHPHIPTWPGGCGFHHDVHIDYADCEGEDTFRVMNIRMHAGIGTHMDAPSHCIAGAKSIHDFDVNDLVMPCVVMDISHKCHERYSLCIQDVTEFERIHGKIAAGSCVFVKTGWSKFWHQQPTENRWQNLTDMTDNPPTIQTTENASQKLESHPPKEWPFLLESTAQNAQPSKYHNNHVFPSVSPGAAELLLDRGVNALGIDTLSPDRPEDGFPVHRLFLGADKIIIENVAHLDSMPPAGSFVMVLPMKIENGTEAPVRLAGLIPRKNVS